MITMCFKYIVFTFILTITPAATHALTTVHAFPTETNPRQLGYNYTAQTTTKSTHSTVHSVCLGRAGGVHLTWDWDQ